MASTAATRPAAKKKKGPGNKHEELLSLQRQYQDDDAVVPHEALAEFGVQDFDQAIESFSASTRAEEDTREQQEEDRRRVSEGWGFDAATRGARGFSLDVSGSKALLDAGYENFDERLVDPTPEHVAIYAGFDEQYRAPLNNTNGKDSLQQTLWSAYFDPLEQDKIAKEDLNSLVLAEERTIQYRAHVIEELAEMFSSGHVPSDMYLSSMWGQDASYSRERWVSAVTERQFDSWLASATQYRSEDDWKAQIVPGHAVQFLDTVHKRGKLLTWVFHVKKGLLLSVVMKRNERAAHLFKLVTHYYTFSLQQAISLIDKQAG